MFILRKTFLKILLRSWKNNECIHWFFTETARQNYLDIGRYIDEESKSIDVAIKFIQKLQKETERLQNFPNSGIFPKDRFLLSVGYRFLVCSDYLIFYKTNEAEKKVIIHAVVNGKRDYKKFLKKI